ncbi:hypothetical protein [Aquiflexum sp.]
MQAGEGMGVHLQPTTKWFELIVEQRNEVKVDEDNYVGVLG